MPKLFDLAARVTKPPSLLRFITQYPMIATIVQSLIFASGSCIPGQLSADYSLPGMPVVIRSTLAPDISGNMICIQQLLIRNEEGVLTYHYDLQPSAARNFHKEFCAAMGMTPSLGTASLPTPSTGWACTMEYQYPGQGPAVPCPLPNHPCTHRAPLLRPPADPRQR